MALVACPECAREVSTRAESCPHCGCPLDSWTADACPAVDDKAARVEEQLEQFKARFAAANARNLRSFIIEAEDLLIHVIGQARYDSLKQDADKRTTQEEEI